MAAYLFLERDWIEAGVVQSLKNVSSMHLRSFEQLETTLDYQLASVGNVVRAEGFSGYSLGEKKQLLSKETNHQWLDTIAVLDPTGNIIAMDSGPRVTSVLPPAVLAQHSFKDAPQHRRILDHGVESAVFFVSRPSAADLGGGGLVSYRMIKSAEGQPLGSVVGFTSLRSLSVLLNTDATRGFDLGKDGVLVILDQLSHDVLYRYAHAGDPATAHKGERQAISGASFRNSRYGPDVKFYQSPFDGHERLAVLAPLHDTRWLQLVAASEDVYLFNWRIQAAFTTLAFICLCIMQWLLLGFFHQNQVQRKALEHDAQHDLMTGLANRRKFFNWAQTVRHQADRFEQPWSVLALDVDHFKKVNDTYGHDAGDAVLRTVADILRANVRDCDIAARFGGEEFIIALPQTELHGAVIVAERIRLALAEKVITVNGREIRCTISIGVAQYQPHSAMDIDEVLKLADAALYRAKALGRNRVELAASAIDRNCRKPAKDMGKVCLAP